MPASYSCVSVHCFSSCDIDGGGSGGDAIGGGMSIGIGSGGDGSITNSSVIVSNVIATGNSAGTAVLEWRGWLQDLLEDKRWS